MDMRYDGNLWNMDIYNAVCSSKYVGIQNEHRIRFVQPKHDEIFVGFLDVPGDFGYFFGKSQRQHFGAASSCVKVSAAMLSLAAS